MARSGLPLRIMASASRANCSMRRRLTGSTSVSPPWRVISWGDLASKPGGRPEGAKVAGAGAAAPGTTPRPCSCPARWLMRAWSLFW